MSPKTRNSISAMFLIAGTLDILCGILGFICMIRDIVPGHVELDFKVLAVLSAMTLLGTLMFSIGSFLHKKSKKEPEQDSRKEAEPQVWITSTSVEANAIYTWKV